MNNSTYNIVSAIQYVTAIIQQRLESGERSVQIDVHDLIEVLLAIAERIEVMETE